MTHKIIENREPLLALARRKLELLSGIMTHYEDIRNNDVFAEEVKESYLELCKEEQSLVYDQEITIPCPGCGFECAQIYSYCMVCGEKLHTEQLRTSM